MKYTKYKQETYITSIKDKYIEKIVYEHNFTSEVKYDEKYIYIYIYENCQYSRKNEYDMILLGLRSLTRGNYQTE